MEIRAYADREWPAAWSFMEPIIRAGASILPAVAHPTQGRVGLQVMYADLSA